MKKVKNYVLIVFMLFLYSAQAQMTLPPSGNNQKSEVTQYLGMVKVTIAYSSPDVSGREIWGKLVPVWFGQFKLWQKHRSKPITLASGCQREHHGHFFS
jgi:hypothetical protein